jgi:hypothetical protein
MMKTMHDIHTIITLFALIIFGLFSHGESIQINNFFEF